MKLEEIAQITIGVLTNREKENMGENSYTLFSLKNYEEKQKYEEFKTNKNLDGKLSKKGDLLFRLLYPNKIIYVDENMEDILIPSQFCIIRAKEEIIDPIVLNWYLESAIGKEELNSKITGSIIKSMSLANLKTIEIPNISMKEQEKMKKLIILWEEEKKISKQILEEKQKLYNFYLEKIVRKEEKNGDQ